MITTDYDQFVTKLEKACLSFQKLVTNLKEKIYYRGYSQEQLSKILHNLEGKPRAAKPNPEVKLAIMMNALPDFDVIKYSIKYSSK
ncbi:MAG: hypothetical protein DWQ04_34205 [Chloroflexi bacterium]|nr:MAG: hypothetical protein DWQ04_34205 [Chloroflexota bacterium]